MHIRSGSKADLPSIQAIQAISLPAAQWDPGVRRVTQVEGNGGGAGAVFDVTLATRRENTLRYHTAVFDPPRTVVVIAKTSILTSEDRITVDADLTGAIVGRERIVAIVPIHQERIIAARGDTGSGVNLVEVGSRECFRPGRAGMRNLGRLGTGIQGQSAAASDRCVSEVESVLDGQAVAAARRDRERRARILVEGAYGERTGDGGLVPAGRAERCGLAGAGHVDVVLPETDTHKGGFSGKDADKTNDPTKFTPVQSEAGGKNNTVRDSANDNGRGQWWTNPGFEGGGFVLSEPGKQPGVQGGVMPPEMMGEDSKPFKAKA